MTGNDIANVPSLAEIRASMASLISQIVEFYQVKNRRSANVQEIVDGIKIENLAETSTVYSCIDPYSDGAEKRDKLKPLLFRRVSPGGYEFLGHDGDPLDLTKQIAIKSPVLGRAYTTYTEQLQKRGKHKSFSELKTSEKAKRFHQILETNPQIYNDAAEMFESLKEFKP